MPFQCKPYPVLPQHRGAKIDSGENKGDFFFSLYFSFCWRETATAEGKSPSSTFQSAAPLLQGAHSFTVETITTQSAMFNLYYNLSLIKVFLLTRKTTVKTTNLHLNYIFKKDLHLMVKPWDPDHRPNAISCSWARSLSAQKTLISWFTDADGHQDGEANLWLTSTCWMSV